LPAVDHNLEEDNLLETAEKLVASLDPDELEDEYVELPLPPAPHHDDSKDDA
jgi:hypothetical protein